MPEGVEGRPHGHSVSTVVDLLPDDDEPEFSYAEPTDPAVKRLLIRGIERVTGQPKLRRLYQIYRRERTRESFWQAAVRHLGLRVRYDEERLRAAPKDRALVVIANHPYGVIDGLTTGYLVERIRADFKIMANGLFTRADELRDVVLPVDFSEAPRALQTNIRSRAEASDHLAAGGCLVIFPAGGISWAPTTFGRAVDRPWKLFTAKLIQKHRADVLPLFFEGQNSPLFHLASRFSMTLRSSLLFHEVVQRMHSELHVRVGEIVPHEVLGRFTDRQDLIDHLRQKTYELGGIGPHSPAEPHRILFFGRLHQVPMSGARRQRLPLKA